MRKAVFSCLLITLLAAAGAQAMDTTIDSFDHSLPAEIDGWRKLPGIAVYTPGNLSNYIDGGAELYISYNFQAALSVKYGRGRGEEITVDIFDQGSSYDAYGVFAHGRETIDTQVGQGCEYVSGQLTFWKDRYYVSIMAYKATPETHAVVMKLGGLIAGAISTEGPMPPVISLLPSDDLLPGSVRYFHHYIWLNSFYFVSDDNILNIDRDTPATLGKYQQASGRYFLLIVQYPDEARAEAALKRFTGEYMKGSGTVMKMADGRWSGCVKEGSVVAAALGAPDEQTVTTMLKRMGNSKGGEHGTQADH